MSKDFKSVPNLLMMVPEDLVDFFQWLLVNTYCGGGCDCRATSDNDMCWCTEMGIILSEAVVLYRKVNYGAERQAAMAS